MGLFWQGYKTKFDKIAHLESRIDEWDFWEELMEYCDELDADIHSKFFIQYAGPIEYGTKFMSVNEKEFYNTFFYYTIWMTYDDDDENFIDKTRYTHNANDDDLGWKKYNDEFYWKAFNTTTLSRIIDDFEKLDFKLLKEKYELSIIDYQKELSSLPDFDQAEYRIWTEEVFINFVNLTTRIINHYKECLSENKDLIICYD